MVKLRFSFAIKSKGEVVLLGADESKWDGLKFPTKL